MSDTVPHTVLSGSENKREKAMKTALMLQNKKNSSQPGHMGSSWEGG